MESAYTKEKEYIGLTHPEVESRIIEGKVNTQPKTPTRTYREIIRVNVFTLFNALNAVLAGLVFLIGTPKNALFANVIVINTFIGIFQEVRAKRTIEKLSMIYSLHSLVIRDGVEKNIGLEEVVIDDLMIIRSGNQIVADALVENGEIEVDESLLTGEADAIVKKKGDKVLSGSFVVSGAAKIRATSVGANTYISKLSNEARKFKILNSELKDAINKIVKVIIIILPPIGVVLAGSQLILGDKPWKEALLGAIAGVVGMVPEGLVLLTSLSFMVAIITMSKRNALVQELPATEILARVNVLCLDKTGTITEGKLRVLKVVPLKDNNQEYIDMIMSNIAYAFEANNPTQNAIMEKYTKKGDLKVEDIIPFSSARKWSGVSFEGEGSFIVGAPEMILKDNYSLIKNQVEDEAKKGRRVLLLAKLSEGKLDKNIEDGVNSIGLIYIEDIIREEAPRTLEYFKEQGVDIKVISGDNPVTVAAIAKRVGVDGSDNYIDARNLPEDEDELREVVRKYSVFGRVTPHQKKAIVLALKNNGNTVAMTGDGVNDVLALKEADCGIAMASGSDATRAVAQIVLLDSNFASLPHIVSEGRKIINNLERVSTLYLSKTFFAVLMAVAFCFLPLPYPFQPIQMTLIGSLTIGIPSFFLALAPNKELVKTGFLERVLNTSIPNAIVTTILTIGAYLISIWILRLDINMARSVSVIVAGGISLMILLHVSMPLNAFKAFLVLAMIGLFTATFLVQFLAKIFVLGVPTLFVLSSVIAAVVVAGILIPVIQNLSKGIIKKYVDKLE